MQYLTIFQLLKSEKEEVINDTGCLVQNLTSLGASLLETSYGSASSNTPQSSIMIGTAGLEL